MGKEGGRMRERGWEERGPQAHSQNSGFGTPYDLRETDFYTPPVLGGASLFDNSAAAVYKNSVP